MKVGSSMNGASCGSCFMTKRRGRKYRMCKRNPNHNRRQGRCKKKY